MNPNIPTLHIGRRLAVDEAWRRLRPREQAVALALLLLIAAWPFVGLFGREPWKADEAYSFGLVWSMLQGHGFVVPLLAGEPFVEKPPLFFWTATAFARAFGGVLSLPDAARLASAFFSLIVLGVVAATGRVVTGRRDGAGLAVLALLASVGLFEKVHLLVTDCALVAGVALGLLGIAHARERAASGGLLLGAGASVALMSKGLLGPGILACTSLALLAFPAWRTRAFVRALAIATLATLPAIVLWPLLLWQQSPDLFREWLWRNNFGRFFGFARLGEQQTHGYYLRTLPWFAFPGWVFAAAAVRATWRDRGAFASLAPSLLAFCIGFAALSIAAEGRSIYATILLVPLAPLAAVGVRSWPAGLGRRAQAVPIVLFGLVLAALGFGWLALQTGVPTPVAARLLARSPGFVPTVGPLASTVAAMASAIFVVVARAAPADARGWLARWVAGSFAAWTLVCTLWLPYLNYGASYESVAESLAAALPRSVRCVASTQLGEPQRALFDYYAGLLTRRTAVDATAITDCDALLVQEVVDPVAVGNGWTEVWSGTRPGDTRERYRLYRRAGAGAPPPGDG